MEFVSDRMWYIVPKGRWCNVIVLNVQCTNWWEKWWFKKQFYDELKQAFDHYTKNLMKILLEDFKAKLGREDINKPTIGNMSLHEDSTDNGVRIANFVTSKKPSC